MFFNNKESIKKIRRNTLVTETVKTQETQELYLCHVFHRKFSHKTSCERSLKFGHAVTDIMTSLFEGIPYSFISKVQTEFTVHCANISFFKLTSSVKNHS